MSQKYPLLPIRNTVLFPGVVMPFLVRRSGGVAAIREAEAHDHLLVTATQKDGAENQPSADGLYRVGTLARIERITGDEKEGFQLLIRGLSRFEAQEIDVQGEGFHATGATADDVTDDHSKLTELAEAVRKVGHEILQLIPGDTRRIDSLIENVRDPAALSFLAAAHVDAGVEFAQSLLEERSPARRLKTLLEELESQQERLSVQREMQDKLVDRLGKSQRDAILREQMKAIREELGDENEEKDVEDLRKRIQEARMPEAVEKIALRELKRLESMGGQSPETHVVRNYIEWLCDMPWSKASDDRIDIERARETLDRDHAGLEKIKKRILQHLAVMKLKESCSAGSILCLVGPPGVGKTSLGQSIASALGREYVRVSLGGVRDESEIRGHRRTYVGAMPGRIVQGLKRAGTNNPVFVLDEIDKLGASFQGDPSAALLEVLDPEQNFTFTDHYLDVPFDLSKVFFIATANSLESVPAPLLDRMEVIELTGYTSSEKLDIASRYLVPKQLKAHGLGREQAEFSDAALVVLISEYTREAGVRGLQRQIGAICREIAEKVARGGVGRIVVTPGLIEEALGPARYEPEVSADVMPPGVVTGLAWTPVGGEILFIEAQGMSGGGKLTLTGQLGDVMKESAQIALSLVRSKLPLVAPRYEFEKSDIHIHVPAGAIPKDGPSAGVAILTAIASLFSGRSVDPKTAMTGEITLRGAVMPVGGIKEKVIAAHRAGIKRVILPKRNRKDLRDVPEEVRRDLRFEFVESADEVFRIVLGLEPTGARGEEPSHGLARFPAIG